MSPNSFYCWHQFHTLSPFMLSNQLSTIWPLSDRAHTISHTQVAQPHARHQLNLSWLSSLHSAVDNLRHFYLVPCLLIVLFRRNHSHVYTATSQAPGWARVGIEEHCSITHTTQYAAGLVDTSLTSLQHLRSYQDGYWLVSCSAGKSGCQHHNQISNSVILYWHGANQFIPSSPIDAECQAGKRQESIL